ncbi:MAG: S46 family peptidase [Gemmatimonadota bacterium]
MPSVRRRTAALLFLILPLFAAACASSGAAPAGEPGAVAAEARTAEAAATPSGPTLQLTQRPQELAPGVTLQPPGAAVQAAQNVTLSGRELGTMWTFENPPLEYWRDTYDFQATPEWLEHVRLSSVLFGGFCSASFVSPGGLVMTNHHCARRCVNASSGPGEDNVATGFYAATNAEEFTCPQLYLDQLVAIQDVTERVRAALPSNAPPTQVAEALEAVQGRLVAECQAGEPDVCRVVPLYQGGQYQLYGYKRYTEVKLVFAPELQAGFFGGDPDNFVYPRWALDMAFVRAYENGVPAATPHFFPFDPDGAAEGEPIFLTGNPGSTARLITVPQLMYEGQYRHPFNIQIWEGQVELLNALAEENPQLQMQVREQLFGLENNLKKYRGEQAGLEDTLLVARKLVWEAEFRERINRDAALRAEYGTLWDSMAALQRAKVRTSPPLNMSNTQFLGVPQLQLAGLLVRYLREQDLPAGERTAGFDPAQVQALLGQPTPLGGVQETLPLAHFLGMADRWLLSSDPVRGLLLRAGETPAEAAARLATDCRVADVAFRQELLRSGLPAAEGSADPCVRAAVAMEARYQELLPRWAEIVDAETVQKQRMGRALFAAYGTDVPPDATLTLRISDGVTARYAYNGTFAAPKTTFHGMFGRAYAFEQEEPWNLPPRFEERRQFIDMSKPVDFVATLDITGGNSGSPVIDRDARVVGLAFDGNIEQLPNEYVFRTETGGRTIAVHAAGILEALRSIYQADALLEELTRAGRN